MGNLDKFIKEYVRDMYLYSSIPNIADNLPGRIDEYGNFIYGENTLLNFVTNKFPGLKKYFDKKNELKNKLESHRKNLETLSDNELLTIYKKVKNNPSSYSIVNDVVYAMKSDDLRKQVVEELLHEGKTSAVDYYLRTKEERKIEPIEGLEDLQKHLNGLDELDYKFGKAMKNGQYDVAKEIAAQIKELNKSNQKKSKLFKNTKKNDIRVFDKFQIDMSELEELDHLLEISMKKGAYDIAREIVLQLEYQYSLVNDKFDQYKTKKDNKIIKEFEKVFKHLGELCEERVKYESTQGVIGKTSRRGYEYGSLDYLFTDIIKFSSEHIKDIEKREKVLECQEIYQKLPRDGMVDAEHDKNNHLGTYANNISSEEEVIKQFELDGLLSETDKKVLEIISICESLNDIENFNKEALEDFFEKEFKYYDIEIEEQIEEPVKEEIIDEAPTKTLTEEDLRRLKDLSKKETKENEVEKEEYRIRL